MNRLNLVPEEDRGRVRMLMNIYEETTNRPVPLSPLEIHHIWSEHSGMYAAGWLFPGDHDEVVRVINGAAFTS